MYPSRFRWVVCQLEMLRRCFPPSLRDALNDLPETLDETYERILLGIDKEKREYAHRLLQCVATAMRPLAAQELAEVLAMRFDCGEIPDYHVDWRQEDSREAVLSACSSLVAVVNADGSSIVQFSHFSVKEYLTSCRLAEAPANLSRYHIDFLSAHTILARASLSVLLHLGGSINKMNIKDFPFAIYAAQHWVDHGRFDGVSSSIQDAMERLFDADNPSFATWLWIYDIDYPLKKHMFQPHPTLPEAVPLYYATLCGFRGVVEHLLATRPGGINSRGGNYSTSLHAALEKDNFEIAALLLEHNADVDGLDDAGRGVLHTASREGHCDKVKFLLERHANVNIGDIDGMTPLELASTTGELEVVEILLGHGASVDSRDKSGWNPLYGAARYGHVDVSRLLIQSGAAVDSVETFGSTPLYTASVYGHLDVVRLLIQYGAAVDGQNDLPPLFGASLYGRLDIVRLLIQSGATVDFRGGNGSTPLFGASQHGNLDVVRLLIESGAAVDSRTNNGYTPLMLASSFGHLDATRELLTQNADPNAQNSKLWTSLHLASAYGHLSIAEMLIQCHAEIDKQTDEGRTPLNEASRYDHIETVRLLLKNGSNPNAKDTAGCTPLQNAERHGHHDIVNLLLESGADLDLRNRGNETPSDVASATGKGEITIFLVECASAGDSREDGSVARLDSGSQNPHPVAVPPSLGHKGRVGSLDSLNNMRISTDSARNIIRYLHERNAGAKEREGNQDTPLGRASRSGAFEFVKILLVDIGVDVDPRDKRGWTPLLYASRFGHLDIARLLVDNGADVNAKLQDHFSALHLASGNGHFEIVQLLLERGANVDVRNDQGRTPSDLALRRGDLGIVRVLSQAGGR